MDGIVSTIIGLIPRVLTFIQSDGRKNIIRHLHRPVVNPLFFSSIVVQDAGSHFFTFDVERL